MGVNTVAVVECVLDDHTKHDVLRRFTEIASEELSDFQEWERSRYGDANREACAGFWCVGDEKFEDVLQREGIVDFELRAPSVIGSIGRFASSMWTAMREATFFQEPKSQRTLRSLAHKFAMVMGTNRVLYVPDNAHDLATAQDMIAHGNTFDEILAFAVSLGDPIPAPPFHGMDLYKRYSDVCPLYFIDDFSGGSLEGN